MAELERPAGKPGEATTGTARPQGQPEHGKVRRFEEGGPADEWDPNTTSDGGMGGGGAGGAGGETGGASGRTNPGR